MPQYPRYTTIAIIINYDKRNKARKREFEGNQPKPPRRTYCQRAQKEPKPSEKIVKIITKVK